MSKVLKFPTTGVFKTGATPENMKRIMKDLKVQMPKLFEVGSKEQIKEAVFEQIKNPSKLKNTTYSRKLLKVINKHINPTKELTEWQKNAAKIRSKLYKAVKKSIASKEFLEFIGCPVDYLMDHLESQFEPGMTWKNYGEWHVDHIRPMCSFNMLNTEEQKECSHFTNLRPLWAKDNIKKSLEDKKQSLRRVK
jgi:hypothetical protein